MDSRVLGHPGPGPSGGYQERPFKWVSQDASCLLLLGYCCVWGTVLATWPVGPLFHTAEVGVGIPPS